jgi:hypothetical protein
MSRIVETIWRSVLWWDLMKKKKKKNSVYMNIHCYITKPQLFKINY